MWYPWSSPSRSVARMSRGSVPLKSWARIWRSSNNQATSLSEVYSHPGPAGCQWGVERGIPRPISRGGRRPVRRHAVTTGSSRRYRGPREAFAEDLAIRRYGERGNSIVHWSDFDRGGHFAAMDHRGSLLLEVSVLAR